MTEEQCLVLCHVTNISVQIIFMLQFCSITAFVIAELWQTLGRGDVLRSRLFTITWGTISERCLLPVF